MEKVLKRINPLEYINGIKGAISLFMAVLLIPFLSIAMVLVDAGKYNSSVSILDEAMGVSANSTLANYDSYLKKRWGLLSVGQGFDLKTKYYDYLTTNTGILGEGIELNSLNVKGDYSLTDSEVLNDQIMEFCKLNAPTTLAEDFLDLDSILKCFESLKSFENILSIFTSASDSIDNTITLVESVGELKTAANNLDSLISQYNSKYVNFQNDTNKLIDELKKDRPEDEAEAASYDNNINTLIRNANTSKSEYSQVLGDIVDNMNTYKEKMTDSSNAINSIESDITSAATTSLRVKQDIEYKKETLRGLNEEISRLESEGYDHSTDDTTYSSAIEYRGALENELAELQTQQGIADATKSGLDNFSDSWNSASGEYNDATFGALIQGFEGLKTKVDNVDIDGITKDTEKITEGNYKYLSINGYVKADEIEAYLAEQEAELQNGGLSALIDGITSFFNSIFSFSLFYDASLSANIDIDYYNSTFGGLPGSEHDGEGVIGVVRSIGQLVKDVKEFGGNLASLKIISALKKIVEIINDVKSVLSSVNTFANNILTNIASLLTGYDKMYFNTYTAYNLPCRTDKLGGNLSFSAMTGYHLSSSSLPDQGIAQDNVTHFGDLAALIDAISSFASGTGDDITFSGAELEYVLFGSNSEIANQLYVFCSLYLFRLIMDIIPVLTDPEIQSLATASTFGYPVVMALVILAEPLADTILLVNGGEVPFWETDIYLSPSGLPGLIENLVSICRFTTEQKESIKGDLVNAFGATGDDYDYQSKLNSWQAEKKNNPAPSSGGESKLKKGFSNFVNGLISFDYRQYCFLMMLITVGKDEQVARVSNLIQMETLYYYQQKGVSYTFDLRNSYTFLDATANVNIKQFLPSLTDSSLFRIDRRSFRGY